MASTLPAGTLRSSAEAPLANSTLTEAVVAVVDTLRSQKARPAGASVEDSVQPGTVLAAVAVVDTLPRRRPRPAGALVASSTPTAAVASVVDTMQRGGATWRTAMTQSTSTCRAGRSGKH